MPVSSLTCWRRRRSLMACDVDMTSRIANNRNDAAAYVTGADAPIGADDCLPDTSTRQRADVTEWCGLLRGASEETSVGTRVGAMVGGRGCVEEIEEGYLVTVAWQGLAPISASVAARMTA